MSEDTLSYIKDTVDRIEAKLDKHDDRLRDVEGWQENANGKITMVGVFGIALGGAITAVIEYFRGGHA